MIGNSVNRNQNGFWVHEQSSSQRPPLDGMKYDITGPDLITIEEAVGRIAGAIGKKVRYTEVEVGEVAWLEPAQRQAIEHMAHIVQVNGTYSEVEGQKAIYVQGTVKKK